MTDMLSYGVGAGGGVVGYYLVKKTFPASPNMASALAGAAMLGLGLFKVIPPNYTDLVTAAGFTMVAIAGVNAVTNPQATMVRVY